MVIVKKWIIAGLNKTYFFLNIILDRTIGKPPRHGIQFTQLWTIFVAIGRHAIHCLMTAKSEELYTALLERISSKIPHFQLAASMSDWSLHQGMLSKQFILKLTFMDAGFI